MKVLEGRCAIITGANQGLGLAIAHAYVEAGARVLLCARGAELLDAARRQLAALGGHVDVDALVADVSSEGDVARLVDHAIARFGRIDILVNNAGVYGPMGPSESVPWDEWMRAMEINVYGSVLPTRAVLPQMKRQRYGKILQVSGGGATNPLPRLSAYAASKAAIVRYAESVALEVRDQGIDINAIAPGALKTRMMTQLLDAGADTVGEAFHARMSTLAADGGTPLEVGARLAVFLASADSDGITGRLISAPWDPWEDLAARRGEIADTDIYTLRRIVPKDRGLPWGDK